jgi:8-oxo-dGTP pyrophosphatase MutT (NUDIX family)
MVNIIQSAGWVVYYIGDDGEARYLLIKRHAISKKIERVAPKGKIEKGETIQEAALREISEEAWIPINKMKIWQKMGVTELRSDESHKWQLNKDTTYFLVQYVWDPQLVSIEDGGWFTWAYMRASITQVLNLVYYQDIRELFRNAYHLLQNKNTNDKVKQDFMEKLDD